MFLYMHIRLLLLSIVIMFTIFITMLDTPIDAETFGFGLALFLAQVNST